VKFWDGCLNHHRDTEDTETFFSELSVFLCVSVVI
jgi:hypothetical protein